MAIPPLMQSLRLSASRLDVENKRMLIIAQNMANSGSRATKPGEQPFQRKVMSMKLTMDSKTKTPVIKAGKEQKDPTPFEKVYSPGDPGADEKGFVLTTNVKPMVEMTDMREAARTHQANLRAYEKTLGVIRESIDLLKN